MAVVKVTVGGKRGTEGDGKQSEMSPWVESSILLLLLSQSHGLPHSPARGPLPPLKAAEPEQWVQILQQKPLLPHTRRKLFFLFLRKQDSSARGSELPWIICKKREIKDSSPWIDIFCCFPWAFTLHLLLRFFDGVFFNDWMCFQLGTFVYYHHNSFLWLILDNPMLTCPISSGFGSGCNSIPNPMNCKGVPRDCEWGKIYLILVVVDSTGCSMAPNSTCWFGWIKSFFVSKSKTKSQEKVVPLFLPVLIFFLRWWCILYQKILLFFLLIEAKEVEVVLWRV